MFNTDTLQAAVKAGNLTPSDSGQIVYVELSDPDNVIVYNQKEEPTGIEAFLESVRSLLRASGHSGAKPCILFCDSATREKWGVRKV